MDMETGGVWPALIETPDGLVELRNLVRVDFIHGEVMPDRCYRKAPAVADVEALPFEVLVIAVVLAGFIVGGFGYAVAVGWIDGWAGARWSSGVVFGFLLRLWMERKQ